MIYPQPKPAAREKKARELRRHKRINRRRAKERRGPTRDREYRKAVSTLPCAAPGAPRGCSRGGCDPAHTGGIAEGKGGGMKTSDFRCVPLCRNHHREFDGYRGVFGRMTEEQRRFFEDEAVDETQVHLGLRRAA